MTCAWAFPGVEKLQLEMVARGWTREVLAEKAGISRAAAGRAVAGKPVAIATIERITRAIAQNPARTATAAFLRGDPPTPADPAQMIADAFAARPARRR